MEQETELTDWLRELRVGVAADHPHMSPRSMVSTPLGGLLAALLRSGHVLCSLARMLGASYIPWRYLAHDPNAPVTPMDAFFAYTQAMSRVALETGSPALASPVAPEALFGLTHRPVATLADHDALSQLFDHLQAIRAYLKQHPARSADLLSHLPASRRPSARHLLLPGDDSALPQARSDDLPPARRKVAHFKSSARLLMGAMRNSALQGPSSSSSSSALASAPLPSLARVVSLLRTKRSFGANHARPATRRALAAAPSRTSLLHAPSPSPAEAAASAGPTPSITPALDPAISQDNVINRSAHLIRLFSCGPTSISTRRSRKPVGIIGDLKISHPQDDHGASDDCDQGSDDDDWETAPDAGTFDAKLSFLASTRSRPRASFTSYTQLPVGEEIAQEMPFQVIFGVTRGRCTLDDGCPAYQKPEDERGGPCVGCGHYPIEHQKIDSEDPAQALLKDGFCSYWVIPFGQLRLDKELASGGFGVVFKGHWQPAGDVAVKKLHPHLVNSERDFIQEVTALCQLRHPNVLLFLGASFGLSENREKEFYLATEFCHGGSLLDYLKKNNPLDPLLLLDLVREAAQGMGYLHQLRLVHCDLKTENIFIRLPATAVVGDLGAACVQGSSNSGARTIQYTAPELMLDSYRELTMHPSQDVFSMGITIWEVFALEYAWPFDIDEWALIRELQNHSRPDLRRVDYIRGLPDLLSRVWAQEPEDRPTMSEIAAELLALKIMHKNGLTRRNSFN